MYDEGQYFPSSNVKSRIFRDCFMMFWEWSSVTGALCSGPGTRCTSPCHSDANVSSRPRIAGILCWIMKLSSNFHSVSKVIKYNNTTDMTDGFDSQFLLQGKTLQRHVCWLVYTGDSNKNWPKYCKLCYVGESGVVVVWGKLWQ